MIRILYVLGMSLVLSILIGTSPVSAKESISSTKDKEVYIDNNQYGEVIQIEIDYSDANIKTEDGANVTYSEAKKISEESQSNTRPLLKKSSKTNGSKTVIPGGMIYKGVTVKQNFSGYSFSYKADYTTIYGKIEWGSRYADRLDRIYGITYSTTKGGSILSKGVFRKNEKSGYSAYGGVKMVINNTNGGNYTVYNYIRVGKDKVWLDYVNNS
ncbi:hypothetical protein LAX75_06935 [Listeria cossartiae]|nr:MULTISPECIES: hypothetical protein [Listeria]MBF2348441.1 hypothetical protein [Listeria marthii]MBF2489000.1 hypothetical protein [Listeria marthii]MBF2512957.1 hypothetical protein [Listeria marthii]MCD2224428.1 hypothetical protein [Listeria cossartiae]MCD2239105.1 hypothetical protein [Listeria cossartiae]